MPKISSIYIAHNFDARDWLALEVLPILNAANINVTSTWITDDSHIFSKNSEQSAVVDLRDIERADYFLLFLDQYKDRAGKGKWFEFGYALRAGKRIILTGYNRECIFVHVPTVQFAEDINAVIALISS